MIRPHLTKLAVVVALLLVHALSAAQAAKLVDGPVLHAPSGSYFALAYERANKDGISWDDARQYAQAMTYKGRSGRLAIVDDLSKHNLLRDTFKPRREAWLGLRYWCAPRMLAWVDLTPHFHGDMPVWMPQWHRTHIRCGANSIEYMGVYYTIDARLWQAAGQQKHFPFFFVEFPAPATGANAKPAPDTAAKP